MILGLSSIRYFTSFFFFSNQIFYYNFGPGIKQKRKKKKKIKIVIILSRKSIPGNSSKSFLRHFYTMCSYERSLFFMIFFFKKRITIYFVVNKPSGGTPALFDDGDIGGKKNTVFKRCNALVYYYRFFSPDSPGTDVSAQKMTNAPTVRMVFNV